MLIKLKNEFENYLLRKCRPSIVSNQFYTAICLIHRTIWKNIKGSGQNVSTFTRWSDKEKENPQMLFNKPSANQTDRLSFREKGDREGIFPISPCNRIPPGIFGSFRRSIRNWSIRWANCTREIWYCLAQIFFIHVLMPKMQPTKV